MQQYKSTQNYICLLEYEFGMDKSDIVKFMCNSVASAITSEERAPMFWDGLEKLRVEYG
tara:strand:+ start:2782 stop:2958 length:177 start_codon:yes stop_codon:yes gene_type:complete